jgi:uncharacterized repeat protein (TIGR03803 family)
LAPNGVISQENVLYDFCMQESCADGGYPSAGLLMDAMGDLYGTTIYGGGHGVGSGGGTVIEWHGMERVLSFCTQTNCADGDGPSSGVIMDASGNLFGTTTHGGANITSSAGTVFELPPQ